MLKLFAPHRTDRHLRRAVEAMMHTALGLGPDDIVRASEVACPARGCTDAATTLLVLRAGCRTDRLRADKPLAEVGPDDFYAPAASPGGPMAALPLHEALRRLRR